MDKLSNNEKRALQELKNILAKKYSLHDFRLFGSKARGDSDWQSDLDVYIVLKEVNRGTEREIYELCFEIGLDYDVVFCPVVFSEKEVTDRFTQVTPFYQVVQREGISL